MGKFKQWLYKNKRYTTENIEGLNVLVETTNSRRKTEDTRFLITLVISIISAVAAIIGAIASVAAFLLR